MATMILVVFALLVGIATMSWGKNYVNEMGGEINLETTSCRFD